MRLTMMVSLLLATGLLAACGSESDGGGASTGGTSKAFPVTIDHKYGSTTIEQAPKRVAVVGLREQDALLALGVVPVATTEWYGNYPGAIFPWAQDELGDAPKPTVLKNPDGIDIEKVASTRPDLILGVYSGITKKEYKTLSKIAPVVAQPKGLPDYGTSWQQETELTGKAVGKPAAATKLVDDTQKLIDEQVADHPEFKGKSAAIVADYQGVFVYGPKDVRVRMLEELGFTFPKALANAVPKDFGGNLSDERTDLLDVDALLWFADGERSPKEIQDTAVYRDLKVRKEARDVFIGGKDRVYDSSSFVSVLSMPTLLKELVPRLAAAVDSDPKTSTDQDA